MTQQSSDNKSRFSKRQVQTIKKIFRTAIWVYDFEEQVFHLQSKYERQLIASFYIQGDLQEVNGLSESRIIYLMQMLTTEVAYVDFYEKSAMIKHIYKKLTGFKGTVIT